MMWRVLLAWKSKPTCKVNSRLHCKWFCEETAGEDYAESVNLKKFRGDLAYKQQEFKKALFEYSGCLALLPLSNIAMRRDVQESQARCLAHLGRCEEALEITEMLQNGATNTDHVTVVLGLKFAIYRTLGHMEEMIGCLQQLISLHPFHPGNWKLLAEAYMSYLQFPLPQSVSEACLQGCEGVAVNHCLPVSSKEGCSQHPQKHHWRTDFSLQISPKINGSLESCEKCQTGGPTNAQGKREAQPAVRNTAFGTMRQEESGDIWIYACASLVRARLLLQLTQSQQSSFALESNLKAQQDIEDKVASFGLKGDVLSLMTEEMGKDLVPEKLKEDAQGEVKCIAASALASLMTPSAPDFEQKWFRKLRDGFFCLGSCT
ncbi:uncharacterized protein C8orf76 homolog isoform X2 [Hemicordylus capensis]|uniref:uncharacterized protein C8orf76 homolog isoform X2 n=1 Tax=Hemicordylus capensis TaxID=884348 RepID=UPI0023046270|nr:uncharacterized protein C8orf76 homolog isoform X2 [Hemicordylus capensis]